MAKQQSPQDKKAASLARDRRNSYGENDKSSRTAIRKRKRWANRSHRQAFRQALHHAEADGDDAAVAAPRVHGWWRKCPDTPLGELLYLGRENRLLRTLRARVAEDPGFLDRLESAAVDHGLAPLAARMILRRLRASFHNYKRDPVVIPDDALALLQRLARRLR